MWYYSSRAEYSILLRRWLCYNHSFQSHVHKLLQMINAAHISSIWYGNVVMIWNALMTRRVAVSWCCCFDIFRRTRITLLKSRQLMQLPFSCLRKPVPFEVPRSTEHTGYLLYTDLLCFGWTALNENTSQKGLCRIPAFLDNLETQLECLAFPEPRAGTAYSDWHGVQSHARGQRLDTQSLKEWSGKPVGR